MNLLKSIKNNIPNTITCLNLLSGAIACILATSGSEHIGGNLDNLTYYQLSFCMIAAAAVFDFLDGFAARLLNAVSSIGKELDSLSDCVSFGLAPTFIVYFMMQDIFPGSWVAYTAPLIAVFGAVRLARFNVDSTQASSFVGLPIPANAIFWIGFCDWFYAANNPVSVSGLEYLALAFILIMSMMMVSPMRMFSLKFKNYGIKDNYHRYLLVAATILSIIIFKLPGLACTIIIYMILAVIFRKKELDALKQGH